MIWFAIHLFIGWLLLEIAVKGAEKTGVQMTNFACFWLLVGWPVILAHILFRKLRAPATKE